MGKAIGRQQGYPTRIATSVARVSFTTLGSWSKSGFIRASVSDTAPSSERCRSEGKPGRKKGSLGRRYTFYDLVALRTAKRLRVGGVSLQSLRRIQKRLASYDGLENPLASAHIVLIPGKTVDVARVVVTEDGNQLLESLRATPGQHSAPAVVFQIAPLVAEVRKFTGAYEAEQAAREQKRREKLREKCRKHDECRRAARRRKAAA